MKFVEIDDLFVTTTESNDAPAARQGFCRATVAQSARLRDLVQQIEKTNALARARHSLNQERATLAQLEGARSLGWGWEPNLLLRGRAYSRREVARLEKRLSHLTAV